MIPGATSPKDPFVQARAVFRGVAPAQAPVRWHDFPARAVRSLGTLIPAAPDDIVTSWKDCWKSITIDLITVFLSISCTTSWILAAFTS